MNSLKNLPIELVLLFIGVVACNTITASPKTTATPLTPVGTFNCYGYEHGMFASAGSISIETEGTVRYTEYYGEKHSGTFTYNATQNEFVFSKGFPLARATYSSKHLEIEVRQGAQITHAEGGSIRCE